MTRSSSNNEDDEFKDKEKSGKDRKLASIVVCSRLYLGFEYLLVYSNLKFFYIWFDVNQCNSLVVFI